MILLPSKGLTYLFKYRPLQIIIYFYFFSFINNNCFYAIQKIQHFLFFNSFFKNYYSNLTTKKSWSQNVPYMHEFSILNSLVLKEICNISVSQLQKKPASCFFFFFLNLRFSFFFLFFFGGND